MHKCHKFLLKLAPSYDYTITAKDDRYEKLNDLLSKLATECRLYTANNENDHREMLIEICQHCTISVTTYSELFLYY